MRCLWMGHQILSSLSLWLDERLRRYRILESKVCRELVCGAIDVALLRRCFHGGCVLGLSRNAVVFERWSSSFSLEELAVVFRFLSSWVFTMVTAMAATSFVATRALSLHSHVSTSHHMVTSSRQISGRHGRVLRVTSSRRSFTVRASGEGGEASASGEDGEDDEAGIVSQVEQADWRAFRARLVRSGLGTGGLDVVPDEEQELWAHPIVKPEAGCVLIAHPNAFTDSQQYFHRVVIFIFAHDAGGSAGVILNRPTQYLLGQLEEFKDLMPELSNCPLYFGGDVGPECTQVIHGVPGLADSREIMNGVFMGGTASIKDSITSGKSTPNDFRWFLRFAGWGPGQLEQEVEAGVWYLGSCSKRFVLKQCIQLPTPLWNEVMEHMGPPYSDIAKRAK